MTRPAGIVYNLENLKGNVLIYNEYYKFKE